MDLKGIFANDLQMIEAVMTKMEQNYKEKNVEENLIMCDLIIDTFTKIKDAYIREMETIKEQA